MMSTSLSGVGLFWAIVSFITAGVACSCYFLPFWLISETSRSPGAGTVPFVPTSFGTFRRCGYLLPFDRTAWISSSSNTVSDNSLRLVEECGRYKSFLDIPSIWWQVATVVAGIGCCLSLLVAFAAVACCCVSDVMSGTVARGAFAVQFLAGLSISAGCVLYPMGWDNPEVRLACGDDTTRFQHGHCQISWAYWTMIACAGNTLVCSLMALHSPKRQGGYQRAAVRV